MLRALHEYTYREIRKSVDLKTRKRAIYGLDQPIVGPLQNKFVRFKPPKSLFYETKSGSVSGKKHKQIIDLLLLPYTMTMPGDFTTRRRVQIALQGDIKVRCSCEAFQYWAFAYIMTQLDANVKPDETRAPTIRNTKLEGSVCKHLDASLATLPFWSVDISRKVTKPSKTWEQLVGGQENSDKWDAALLPKDNAEAAKYLTKYLKTLGRYVN
jgi:hypothetical protein